VRRPRRRGRPGPAGGTGWRARLPRPSWQLPTLLFGGLVWLGALVAGEVLGGVLTSIRWLAGALLVAGLLAWIGQRLLPAPPEEAEPEDLPRADQPVPLPAPPELTGRAAELAAALHAVRQHGVLLLHGPRGIGTSALALATAAELAAGAGPGTYADLRASQARTRPEPPPWARARVLAALGLAPDAAGTDEGVYDLVAAALRDTGRVLVLDNVRDPAQVAWLHRPVPGAYVLVAGDLPPVPELPDLPVGPLGPDDGLALLRADPAVAPRAQARRESRELARRYLKFPVVVVTLRSWLAANPRVGIRALLEDLDGGAAPVAEPSELLRTVLALHTRGLSAPARQLLSLLPHVPLTWLTDAAAGALLGRPRVEARPVLDELARSGLLVATMPTRFRVPREARALGSGDEPEARAAALARLIALYAGEATEQREALRGARSGSEPAARAWFRREEDALLALLRVETARSAAPRVALIGDALDVWYARDGRLDDRRLAAEAAAAAAEALGDADGRVTALLRLAAVARAAGELTAAAGYLQLAETTPADPRLAVGRGQLAYALGDRSGAGAEFERNLSRRPGRDAVGRVIDQLGLAAVRLGQGQLAPAARLLREAETLAADVGDAVGVAYARELLGLVAVRSGDAEDATARWAEAQLRYEQLHDDDGQARCLLHRATVLVDTDPARARELLADSVGLRGDRPGVGAALAHVRLAELARDGRTRERHRQLAREALAPWQDRLEQPEEVAALLGELRS
jgi:tetratricopeptide (TPR) repeat protein